MLWTRTSSLINGLAAQSGLNLKVLRWSSAISKPVFHRGDQWDRRRNVAMIDENGNHTYGDISIKSRMVANALQKELGHNPEKHKKISFLCGNNSSFVNALWGIWRWGHVAVPLCKTHPTPNLEYYVKDSESLAVIATKDLVDKVHPFMRGSDRKLLLLEEILDNVHAQEVGKVSVDIFDDDIYDENNDAMLIYTSGTTGSPKGVVLSHRNIIHQINGMLDAWGWSEKDCILHVLPLHHTHGMINCLLCPLAVGAKILMLPKFDAGKVWEILLNRNETNVHSEVDVFMAVPTIYAKLIQKFQEPEFQAKYNAEDVKATIMEKIRLMVCGSAALPTPILKEWKKISGHTLLERYGATELGMVLSDPFEQSSRKPGFVGNPMPGVQVRIVKPGTTDMLVMGDYDGTTILSQEKELIGELQVKGPSVFKKYYNRPDDTKTMFTKDKWFKSGDTAEFVPSDGSDGYDGAYRVLGRSNVDVIKSGGYKVSALDVERILLSHENVAEVAVCGVEDLTWGQKVGAVVVFEQGVKPMELAELREWAEDKLPKYSLPTVMKVMDQLPRNVMGQVNKKDLVKIAFPPEETEKTAAQ